MKKDEKTMNTGSILAKSASLVVLGVIAAVTLIMAFAPAGSIYNG
ncbi:hypothetical protein [Henriciella pelagia]